MPSNANGLQMTPADPYGDEAFTFVKELIMQREVSGWVVGGWVWMVGGGWVLRVSRVNAAFRGYGEMVCF